MRPRRSWRRWPPPPPNPNDWCSFPAPITSLPVNSSRCSSARRLAQGATRYDPGQRFRTRHSALTATEIFTGAIAACNIASAFDRRMRFEGNTLHRLLPDGSGPATIDLSSYKRIFVIALGKAAGPMLDTLLDAHEAPQGPARHLLLEPAAQEHATGASATSRAATRCPTRTPSPRPAPRWPCSRRPRKTR